MGVSPVGLRFAGAAQDERRVDFRKKAVQQSPNDAGLLSGNDMRNGAFAQRKRKISRANHRAGRRVQMPDGKIEFAVHRCILQQAAFSSQPLDVKPAAGRPAAHGCHFFDPAALGGAFDGDDHIYRFGDQFRVGRHASFLNELTDADQRRAGVVRMHSSDPAGVTRIPGFEQGQGAAVAHFADHDAIRAQPHGGAQQPGHVGVVAGAQEEDVFSVNLQFARVLDHHDAVFTVKPGHGVEDGVG